MQKFALIVLVIGLMLPQRARADELRQLIMSSAYGVLAGTLVGAATLAFTERPGDNLRNIARGASLGLYAGILLGLYVIYVVPEPGEEEPEGDVYPSPESHMPSIYPILGENSNIEGVGVTMKVMSF